MDVHGPHTRQWDTHVGLGSSSHGGTSAAIVDTFQGHKDEDDDEGDEEAKERGYDELAESQLQDALRLSLRRLQERDDAVRLARTL